MTAVSPEAVRAQLDRVFASAEFAASQRLRQFLQYVVDQSLAGNAGAINQRSIASEALGYGPNFDPQLNPSVRIHAKQLRRSLERYYLTVGVDDPVRIDVPKGGYAPVFLEQPTSTVGEPPTSRSQASARSALESLDPAVAVVLFDSLNDGNGSTPFAVGLTEEITVALTRFANLGVLGPLLEAGGSSGDPSKIGHEVGARFVLQGRVRSQGSVIRVTTALSDAVSGSKLWGKTFQYDVETTSLFDIEDEIVSQVVATIADGLGVIFHQLYSDTSSAHIRFSDVTYAVLAYNRAWLAHGTDDWRAALDAINVALEKQPRNALMIAMKSNVYYGDVMHDLGLASESRERMEELAIEAVSLDATLQVARYNLVVQAAFHGRVQECVAEAQNTLALNPNTARILAGCAVATSSVGEYNTAMAYIERAMRLNPHYPGWYHFIPYLAKYDAGQYDQAWSEARRIVMPELIWHPLLRASVLGQLGRAEEAQGYLTTLLEMKPDFASRPRDYLAPLFVLDRHIDMIWDGLRKAGVESTATSTPSRSQATEGRQEAALVPRTLLAPSESLRNSN